MSYNDNAPEPEEREPELTPLTKDNSGITFFGNVNVSLYAKDPNGDYVNPETGERYRTRGFLSEDPILAQSLVSDYGPGNTLNEEFGLNNNILSGSEALNELKFQSQCVLLENYESLVKHNYLYAYKNFISVHGNPSTIVNKLTSRTDIPEFLDITTDQLSQLSPSIRLFKVYYDKDTGEETKQIELPFDQYFDTAVEQTNNISAGGGVGLLDFNWKYVGAHPAETLNNIEATLRLRFQNIKDITDIRYTPDGKFRYIDLLIRTDREDSDDADIKKRRDKCTNEVNNRKYDIDYFTIKIIVGWEAPDNAFQGLSNRKALLRSIRSMKTILYLTLTNHEIEFRQDGTVVLQLIGNARHDAAKKLKGSDVFGLYRQRYNEIAGAIADLQRQRKEVEEAAGDTPSAFDQQMFEAVDNRIKALEENLEGESARVKSSILKELIVRDRIFQVTIPTETLQISKPPAFRGLGGLLSDNTLRIANREQQRFLRNYRRPTNITPTKFRDCDKFLIDPSATPEQELSEQAEGKIGSSVKDGKFVVPFIYFGDLIDVALESMYGKDKVKAVGTRTLIGDILIYDPRKGAKVSVNMADVPVSMWTFQDWLIENVYKQQKVSYPISKFISDAITQLIYEALKPNKCFDGVPEQQVKVGTNLFYLPSIDNGVSLLDPNNYGRILVTDGKNYTDQTTSTPETGYTAYNLIYSQIVDEDQEPYNPDETFKRGIHTAQIGEERGLVREINFKRSDQPYYRETVIFGEDGTTIAQLREHYRAEITMFGNSLYLNGQLVFINPSTIAFGNPANQRSDGNILGITGYYRITEVDNYIGVGQFDTTLSAIWEASGAGNNRGVFNVNRTVACSENPDEKKKPKSSDFDLRYLNRFSNVEDPVFSDPTTKVTLRDLQEQANSLYDKFRFDASNIKAKKEYEKVNKQIRKLQGKE